MAKFAALGIVLGLVLTATTTAVLASEVLSFPSGPIPTAPGLHLASQPLTGQLSIPGKGGAYPAIILLHGCGGIGSTGNHEELWADRLNGWGYATLIVDSLHPRGMSEVCSPAAQSQLKMYDRAGDAIHAAVALGRVAGVDAHRIGVVGFSHGGGSAVMLTQKGFDSYQPGLIKAAVDYYGGCYFPQYRGTVPLLVLAGDADRYGDPAKTCTEFKAALPQGRTMDLQIYQAVYHEFDNPFFRARRYAGSFPLQYDLDAARDSIERVHTFLDRYVMNAK